MAQKTQLTQTHKVFIAIIAVFGIILMYNNVFKPLNVRINTARTQLEQKERKLVETKNKAQNLDFLKQEYQQVIKRVQVAEKKLPKNREIPQLIRDVTNVGKKYGIEINILTPQPVRAKQYYQEFPFGMNISTRFNMLAQFFSDLGQFERIFKIENLNISEKPAAGPEDMPGVSATYTLVAFTARD